MVNQKVKEKLDTYRKAISRLEDILNEEISNDYIYDAVIRRFEFTYEVAWKLMKLTLEYKGIVEARSPRDVFREAFAVGIIKNGDVWFKMLTDRNLTSHTYDQETAIAIYHRIKDDYFETLNLLIEQIERSL
ncbi:nucleotidyltransferase substrate binding protein [Heliobacterium chlorum]|uniref:Nucleotidyltransferase substrate binding protein n=1 Tax=Heliobacterium chlorum TaxID=2698 RepID=A0ABR7SZY9_HELCL|nr:nucleotidyltransferase substrate binding protein [Heliobacterium chlorum]MBC9784112.1 nucleotidyltransferase substrate binding protein [Heliobacterium chlorum]